MRGTIGKAGATIGGLVALYIVVFNGSKAGAVLKAGADGSSKFVKTLQGR